MHQAPPTVSPEDLLRRFRETGEPGALGALFDATAPELFQVALALAPDAAAAEDALQETYIVALEAADRWDGSRPVVPWLVGILRIEVLRSRRREARVPDPARLDPPILPEDPADAAARGETRERVRAALEALPEPYRSVGLLRWRYGLEPAEIAEFRKEPPGTVRSLLHRAAERLRRTLGSLAAIALGPSPPKGLEGIRDQVLSRAGRRAVSGAGITTVAVAGGFLMAKKAFVGVVVLLLLGWGAWRWQAASGPDGGGGPSAAEGPPATAKAPEAGRVQSPGAEPATATLPPALANTARSAEELAESRKDGASGDLPPDYLGMMGTVVDGERHPAKGAQVRLHLPDGHVIDARSGEDGTFRFQPPRLRVRGRCTLRIVATDERKRVGWYTQQIGFQDRDPGDGWVVPSLTGLEIILRDPCSTSVRVVSGDAPVAGATVRAETEEAIPVRTEDLVTGPDGTVVLEVLPAGSWTVLARAPGRGRGRARIRLPLERAGPVDVAISSRTIEVEVVAAGSGKPVEGAGIEVWEEQFRGDKSVLMPYFAEPLAPPPTDSSGRTRIEGVGADERFEVRPIPPGATRPAEGTLPVALEPGATSVRLEIAGKRRIRWPIVAGERAVPPDGTEVRIVEASTLRMLDLGVGDQFTGRVEGGEISADGFGWRALSLVAIAPDGSLARLHAAADANRGEPTSFADPKTLEVVVRDEDGKPVTDSIVVLKDETGEPLATMETPDEKGRTLFEKLPGGTVVVCPLAHWDYGGAEAARVDLSGETRKVEVVVGRAFPVGIRIRIGGKPRLPAKFDIVIRYPGPSPIEGLSGEQVRDAKEDPDRGEVRFAARPHAPGKPVALEIRVPGHDDLHAEVAPRADRAEAWVEFDLPEK